MSIIEMDENLSSLTFEKNGLKREFIIPLKSVLKVLFFKVLTIPA
jgi:hypothetical protein